jgi:hypothetical protein
MVFTSSPFTFSKVPKGTAEGVPADIPGDAGLTCHPIVGPLRLLTADDRDLRRPSPAFGYGL